MYEYNDNRLLKSRPIQILSGLLHFEKQAGN